MCIRDSSYRVPVNNSPVFGNASSITECNFVTNEQLPEGLNPIAFISLWGVDDIPIARSTFINELPSANTTEGLGKGIYSHDASFKVSGCNNTCSPANECCDENTSSFTNLSHGVYAQSGQSMRNFIVDGVNFENCNYGVYFSAVNFAQITRSEFRFGFAPNSVARTYGIVNEGSTGFQIEENTFLSIGEANSNTIGTLMLNAGSDNNRIFNNEFNDLNYANWAIGNNAAPNFGNGENTGLLYECNKQTDSKDFDINVLFGSGIRSLQGSVDQFLNFLPTNNTFSNTGANLQSDIAVSGGSTNNVNYVYGAGTNEEPIFFTSSKVTPIPSGLDNGDGCQSSFENPNDKEIKRSKYNLVNEEFISREQTYIQKIDNGNTNYFLNQLAVLGPNNLELKNELLAVSPYVSMQVIERIIETSKFTESHLFSILNANPDVVRALGLIETLPFETSLSGPQLQILAQNIGNVTERGKAEYLLTSLKGKKDQYTRELLHLLLFEDRSSETNQEIDSWLESTESLVNTYAKVDLLFETGASEDGLSLLTGVPLNYNLNQEETLEYQNLLTLYQLLYNLPTDGRNEAYFTDAEYSIVDGLATTGQGKAKIKARNIMGFFYDKIYQLELPEQATQNEASSVSNLAEVQLPQESTDKLSLVTVSPNPTNTDVNIHYVSQSLYENKGEILVINFQGQTYFQESFDAQEKNISLDVENWPSGMYFCIFKFTSSKQELIPFLINH